jgi:hypothetical protein
MDHQRIGPDVMSGAQFQMLLAGSPRITRRVFTDSDSGATSYTISTGTASSGRITVVAVTYTSTAASGVTLDGNAMTAIVTPATGGGRTAIYALANPTGTSSALVLTGANALNAVAVYAVTGASGVSAFDSAGAASRPISVDVPENGICIAACYSNNVSTGYTFSGVANDATYSNGSSGGAQGSAEFTTEQAPLSVNFTSSGATFGLAAASWGP